MTDDKKIALVSDHAGYPLKAQIATYLESMGYQILDLGPDTDAVSVDYPLKAAELAHALKDKKAERGIAICGTGIGVCIALNRFPFIRAALVDKQKTALFSRLHNDANVLCLGGRITPYITAIQLVETFLNTPFEGGRHQRRVLELGEMK